MLKYKSNKKNYKKNYKKKSKKIAETPKTKRVLSTNQTKKVSVKIKISILKTLSLFEKALGLSRL